MLSIQSWFFLLFRHAVVFVRLKAQLQRWQIAESIDATTVQRLEAYEESRHGFRFSTAMFGLSAFAIVLGVAAVAGSNWDAIPATLKLIAHTLMNLALTARILHSVTRCLICPKIPPAPHGISTPNIARGNRHATPGPQYPVAKVPRCLVSAAPINTPFSRKMLCAEPQAS